MSRTDNRELQTRIAYLEAKVEHLKQHCIEVLESSSSTAGAVNVSGLGEALDAERRRAAQLNEELMQIKAHRDDIEQQVKHQHQHVLYLTEKIRKLEAPSYKRIRVLGEWLQQLFPRKSATAELKRS